MLPVLLSPGEKDGRRKLPFFGGPPDEDGFRGREGERAAGAFSSEKLGFPKREAANNGLLQRLSGRGWMARGEGPLETRGVEGGFGWLVGREVSSDGRDAADSGFFIPGLIAAAVSFLESGEGAEDSGRDDCVSEAAVRLLSLCEASGIRQGRRRSQISFRRESRSF